MRIRLWHKVAALLVVGILEGTALTLFVNYQRERAAIETRYRESVEALATTLSPVLLETLLANEVIDPDNTREVLREIALVYGDLRSIAVLGDDGQPLDLGSEWGSVPPEAHRVVRPITILSPGETPREIGRIEVAFDATRLHAARRSLIGHAVTLGAVAILVAVSFSILVARGITVPLATLALGMKRLESDDLDVRVNLRTKDEVGDLAAVFNRLVEGMQAKRELIHYVPKSAWEAAHRRAAGGAESSARNQELTILFSDVVGFTPMTEVTSADELVRRLNRYFEEMAPIVTRNGGMIDKFIGDAIMAIFEASTAGDAGANAAVSAALEMQARMAELRVSNPEAFRIRIGVNTGVVILGDIGAMSSRRDYTCVGSAVNVAQRFESTCPVDAVHVGSSTFRRLDPVPPPEWIKRRDGLRVKGVEEPLTTYVLRSPWRDFNDGEGQHDSESCRSDP
ncbi:HAMP domain-containing protein [bacterium]|nr:HAMP domain-containing protein [bacterium]